MDKSHVDFMRWEDDEEAWRRWCEGRAWAPIVDAGMRQLREIKSNYLRTHLLIDYRREERFFAELPVDRDLRSNEQGWGPGIVVLDPTEQADKYDPQSEYIRKWVPELKRLRGSFIFDPYKRLDKRIKYKIPVVRGTQGRTSFTRTPKSTKTVPRGRESSKSGSVEYQGKRSTT